MDRELPHHEAKLLLDNALIPVREKPCRKLLHICRLRKSCQLLIQLLLWQVFQFHPVQHIFINKQTVGITGKNIHPVCDLLPQFPDPGDQILRFRASSAKLSQRLKDALQHSSLPLCQLRLLFRDLLNHSVSRECQLQCRVFHIGNSCHRSVFLKITL